jgi:hypothetical protein
MSPIAAAGADRRGLAVKLFRFPGRIVFVF